MKTFIFKYDPSGNFDKIFSNIEQAVKTGKPNIQPKNVIKSNSLEVIYRSITPSRWEIFTSLVEKKPTNLTELTRLLKKDYANVWKDVRALEGLGIVKLKKEGKEIRPVALYERIVFDLPVYQRKELLINQIQVENFNFLGNFKKIKNRFGIIYNYDRK